MKKLLVMSLLLCSSLFGCTEQISINSSDTYAEKLFSLRLNIEEDGYIIDDYYGNFSDITIPDTYNNLPIVEIDDEVFKNNESIHSVIISSNITRIGVEAFYECINLTNVIFNEGSELVSIEKDAFLNCEQLQSFIIPNNVSKIGNSAFKNCNKLTSITLNKNLTSLGENAFADCTSLESVVFEENISLDKISGGAFKNCISLTEITIPTDVSNIGPYAFSSCTNLSKVNLNELLNLTEIGNNAFENCESLVTFYLPKTISTISDNAFLDCSSLTIYCEAHVKPNSWAHSWASGVKDVIWSSYFGIKGATNDYRYIAYLDETNNPYIVLEEYLGTDENVIIPNTLNINEEEIPVREIGFRSFIGNDALTSITISDNITTIDDAAFNHCENLKIVYIGPNNNLTKIGTEAFANCYTLSAIFIPISVTNIEAEAFYSSKNLTVYCEASTVPDTWSSNWDYSYINYFLGVSYQTYLNIIKNKI